MSNITLPAFTPKQFEKAKIYLATQVAEMMGRKFEEGDWAKVYCAAKEIPEAAWSNLDIDVMAGPIGVEQKMLCRRENQPILDAAGTRPMHPAGTRAVRVPPGIEDATEAAREVLAQYGELIDSRTEIVKIVHLYHHERFSRDEAMTKLTALGMGVAKAGDMLPNALFPMGHVDDELDMRTGWLLWQQSLREFLYFEEKMIKPNPEEYTAKWVERKSGRRKGSRNLWVYKDGLKRFSITNEAGVKLQPYFDVPRPDDENMYHFVVQGEEIEDGLIRVWLTQITANLLQKKIGSLEPQLIAEAIEKARHLHEPQDGETPVFDTLAIEVLVPKNAYSRIKELFSGVSDEHNFKQLIDCLEAN